MVTWEGSLFPTEEKPTLIHEMDTLFIISINRLSLFYSIV
jgi:hypothetical protein